MSRGVDRCDRWLAAVWRNGKGWWSVTIGGTQRGGLAAVEAWRSCAAEDLGISDHHRVRNCTAEARDRMRLQHPVTGTVGAHGGLQQRDAHQLHSHRYGRLDAELASCDLRSQE